MSLRAVGHALDALTFSPVDFGTFFDVVLAVSTFCLELSDDGFFHHFSCILT